MKNLYGRQELRIEPSQYRIVGPYQKQQQQYKFLALFVAYTANKWRRIDKLNGLSTIYGISHTQIDMISFLLATTLNNRRLKQSNKHQLEKGHAIIHRNNNGIHA